MTIKKVTIEYDDCIMQLRGAEAAKWEAHNNAVAVFAQVHNCNPFKSDPIKWTKIKKK